MAEKSKVLALARKILEDHQEVGSVNAITKIFDIPYAKVKLPNGRCRGAVDLSEGVEIWWPQIDPLRPNSGWVNVARTNADGEIVEIEDEQTALAGSDDFWALVNLISRLYDVTDGEVCVGGRNVKEYDLESLRNQVSVVLQKNVLFAGTIKENLRWGNENATDDEIVEACRLAQAEEFVLSFPEGYDRMIDQGGANVSGGQKQRLCIARALLKKPKILILDDSTSAVDTKTDALIRRGFETYIPDTTKIIIAQRIASVEHADRIIVMDNGTVTDVGTHDELLKTSRIYREVYEQQTKGGDDNA